MTWLILYLALAHSAQSNVDPLVVLSIIQVESNFDTQAEGDIGELGLMQLRPEYYPEATRADLLSPDVNIRYGVEKLALLKKTCPHQVDMTWVICFNLGVKGAALIHHPKLHPYYKRFIRTYKNYKREFGTRPVMFESSLKRGPRS